jgi:Tfp pilus assembly protein PilN
MRTTLTILLITADRLVRADVRGSDCRVAEQARPAVDDLPSLVEAALRLGGGRARRVLLLTTEVWTQTLPLPAGAAAGMSDDEVAQALAFEAEPFSGISAFDSLAACLPLPRGVEEPQFWFTQMPASVHDQLEYVVGEAGGKLVGIGHPAGLPRSLRTPPDGRWQRIELWPDAVVCLHRDARGPMHVHVVNTSPHTDTWQQDARLWFGQFEAPEVCEILLASGRAAPPDEALEATESIDLADEASLSGWLRAWAEQVQQRRPEAPLLRPAPRPMPNSTRLAIAGLVGAAMLALCLMHYGWTQAGARAAQARVTELKEPADELRKAQTEADALEKELTALTSQTERMQASVDACLRAMEWNRQRMAGLMAALAESEAGAVCVQAIEAGREGIRVRGISRGPEQPNRLAARMATKLRPLGLQVHPPTKEAAFLMPDGTPYLFEMLIQDIHHTGQPFEEAAEAGGPEPSEGVAQSQRSTER